MNVSISLLQSLLQLQKEFKHLSDFFILSYPLSLAVSSLFFSFCYFHFVFVFKDIALVKYVPYSHHYIAHSTIWIGKVPCNDAFKSPFFALICRCVFRSMCLLFVYINSDPKEGDYKLILVNNRDENYNRPTKPARFWDSGILGGKYRGSLLFLMDWCCRRIRSFVCIGGCIYWGLLVLIIIIYYYYYRWHWFLFFCV